MKRFDTWPRILIGILLILNALPWTLGAASRPAYGLIFLISGLVVLVCPFKIPERSFSFIDAIRTIISALLFVGLFFVNDANSMFLPLLLFSIGLLILFVPIKKHSHTQSHTGG